MSQSFVAPAHAEIEDTFMKRLLIIALLALSVVVPSVASVIVPTTATIVFADDGDPS